ncbi:NADH dehydrogenase subunit 2 (mitochondrion) [Sergentomyia squamirostris]
MLFNPSKMLFMSTLMLGIFITISSNSWLSAWMGLEINLLSFIPLMMNKYDTLSNEASLKYFLTQAMASSLLLFSIILFLNHSLMNFNLWNFNFLTKLSLINLILLIKTGSAPFHFWFPSVMNSLSWFNSWILMTLQKIAPFILIFYVFNYFIAMTSLIFSLIFGAIGGLNQISIRKIMSYSSINHMSWMLTAMFFSKNLWLNYFIFYSLLTTSIVLLFNFFNIFYLNQIFLYNNNFISIKFSTFILLLSLGGLPPFIGFFPKWLIIQYLLMNNFYLILILNVMFTLITLFFYLQLTYSAFMINSTSLKWMYIYQPLFMKTLMIILSYISIFGLIIMSLFFNY